MKLNNLVLLGLLLISISLQGCLSIMVGTQRPLALLDVPENMVVKNKTTGETLPLKMVEWGARSSATQSTTTYYLTRGVLTKAKKGTVIELSADGKTVEYTPKLKSMTGTLIIEGFVSFGIFAFIDMITGASRKFEPNIVDVPATLNNTTPRSLEEMRNVLYSRSSPVR
ncbi:MAG: hypothetical protein RIQ89_1776 [Bacteroidota bacterium]|jgi:hypothetical protein